MSDRQLSLEITGRVLAVLPWQEFASGFRKRSIVIEIEDGKYPQEILVEFAKERGDLLKDARPGMTAKIGADLRGRKWQRDAESEPKWFLSVNGWRIDLDGADEEDHDPGAYGEDPGDGPADDGIPF